MGTARTEEEDDKPNRSIVFSNSMALPLQLSLEPEGEDYWILPGKELRFHYRQSDLHVDWGGLGHHVVALYGATEGDWAVYEGDERVECGHNRPPGWN